MISDSPRMFGELSDEYTEDTRAFRRRYARSPGLEESESGSESDQD